MGALFKKLKDNKFDLNSKSVRLKMEDFLSFLNIKVERVEKCLGWDLYWTELVGDNGLIIRGGKLNYEGKVLEFFHSLQYGKNINNPYNNFVNPLEVGEIFNDDGIEYFYNVYEEDIKKIISEQKDAICDELEKMQLMKDDLTNIGISIEDL